MVVVTCTSSRALGTRLVSTGTYSFGQDDDAWFMPTGHANSWGCRPASRRRPTRPYRLSKTSGLPRLPPMPWCRRGVNTEHFGRSNVARFSGTEAAAPFSRFGQKGVACTTGTAERDPTELEQSAQPASHRPTGACHHGKIIPPSRFGAERSTRDRSRPTVIWAAGRVRKRSSLRERARHQVLIESTRPFEARFLRQQSSPTALVSP